MSLRAVNCRGLRRTELFVNLDKTFLNVVSLILFDSRLHSLVVTEEVEDFGVGTESESSDEGCYGKLSVLINTNIENVVYVGLVLEPRASVGDNGGGVELFTGFVVIHLVINARRTNEL